MTSAVVYARISDDRTGERAGVSRQEADARALCERRGWDVADVIVDNDVSASRYTRSGRPGWRRVVAMAAAGDVQVIAAWHTDRLYRRPAELEELIDLAEQVTVATVEGDFRLDTSDGRAMARVIAAMAAKESDDKSRRLRRKHEELAAEGRVSGGGRRPFGYLPDRVTIDPDEAELIREAAGRITAGETLHAVAADWRRRGVATVTGGPWQTTTLKRLLCSARVAGRRTHNGHDAGEAVWPAILDEVTARRVRAVLTARDGTGQAPARTYLLSGIVRCGACGALMTASPVVRKGNRYRRYHCRVDRGGCNRVGIGADGIERDVGAAVLDLVALGGPVAAAPVPGAPTSPEELLVDAQTELRVLADQVTAGVIGRETMLALAASLEDRIVALRRQVLRNTNRARVEALAAAADPPAAWGSMTLDQRRAVIADLVDAVTVEATSKANNRYDWSRVTIRWRDLT